MEEEVADTSVMGAPTQVGALPNAQGGRGQCVGREVAMVPTPPPAHHSTMLLCFYGGPGFLQNHSQLQISSLPSLQAVSSQLTAVLCSGLVSKSPCLHWRAHISGWGRQGCG